MKKTRIVKTPAPKRVETPKLGDGIYKDGNPKTQFGAVKPGLHSVPPMPLYEYGLAHMQGALKYGHYNWRDDPVSVSTYTEAAKRHIDLFLEGQKNASDTGIHNLAHAMCCLSILMDAEFCNTLIDDRKKTILHGKSDFSPADAFDKWLDDNKERVTKIKKEWTGHAEKLKLEQQQKAEKKLSKFQQEMIDHPERAVGKFGNSFSTGQRGVVDGVLDSKTWKVITSHGAIIALPTHDFIIDHGR